MTHLIKTERLEIRPFAGEDRNALSELLLSEEISKTFMIPDIATDEELDKLLTAIMGLSRSDEHFTRGIYLQGKLIGFVNDVEMKDRYIELGYVIHPSHWGKGYATEVLGAVIGELLGRKFSCIAAGAFTENPASLRVMEKCGMRRSPRVEEVEYRGERHCCVYYEIMA